ncbi:MAG: glycosyltransferase family 4 protein [Opitutaceae bacterium]|nr:glycosyltransferase family 4 protein [Opitutaceae bacterium]
MKAWIFFFAGVVVAAGVAVRVMRWVALRRALLDRPNTRSSHELPVPRLGGGAFMPVVLGAIALLAPRAAIPGGLFAVFLGGAALLFVVGLIDDVVSLSTGLRFAVHFAVAGAVLAMAAKFWPAGADVAWWSAALRPPGWGFWALAIWIVGVLNLYNFMDGIDGLAGVQAVVAGAFWTAAGMALGAPWVAVVGAAIAAGSLGFLSLNWPPAKIFMGDAGSTVLGFCFAALPLLAVVEMRRAGQFELWLAAGALAVWPFLADGTFTILRRLRRGENILQAHRSHLYQRLVIAGVSHARVTIVYGALALLGAGLGWRVLRGESLAVTTALGAIAAAFFVLWRWVLRCERRGLAGAVTS